MDANINSRILYHEHEDGMLLFISEIKGTFQITAVNLQTGAGEMFARDFEQYSVAYQWLTDYTQDFLDKGYIITAAYDNPSYNPKAV